MITKSNYQLSFLFVGLVLLFLPLGRAAADDTQCLIAKEHARNGQEAYGRLFDAAEEFLRNNEINYDLYGKKRFSHEYSSYGTKYNEAYCTQIYGGCGADKFDIDVSLNQSKKDYPIVLVTPKSGATATEKGYVIVGKLRGVINHENCIVGEFVDGHTWKANVSLSQVLGNIDDSGWVATSLSGVGATIHQGFRGNLPSYEARTLVVDIDDFGNGPNFDRFLAIINQLPGSGVVNQY